MLCLPDMPFDDVHNHDDVRNIYGRVEHRKGLHGNDQLSMGEEKTIGEKEKVREW
jgi:hypothetical protein